MPFTDEQRAEIIRTSRELLQRRHEPELELPEPAQSESTPEPKPDPNVVLPFVRPKAPEPEPERRRYTDSVVDRLLAEAVAETRTQLEQHRTYVSSIIQQEFEAYNEIVGTAMAEYVGKYLENDVAALESQVNQLRTEHDAAINQLQNDLVSTRAEIEALAAEIGRLRDAVDVALEDRAAVVPIRRPGGAA